mmetsp:Transcript_13540/g.43204  ORF Transcript_13540/g.43204 Transcript_13540/m.43204 type:complete len:111 (+) Transcript_13540:121-453(+)
MGSDLSRSLRAWRARRLRRVVVVGLDNSGKTTAVRQIKGVEPSGSVPTTEAEYREASYKGLTLLLTVSRGAALPAGAHGSGAAAGERGSVAGRARRAAHRAALTRPRPGD